MFHVLYANAAPSAIPSIGGVDVMRFVPFLLIFVVFYFLLFKPQNDKMKKQKQMQADLKVGDQILTNSGFLGKISKLVNDEEILLEIADGVKVRCLKQVIVEKRGK
jgi:preprotein translocase subunit YajC